MRLSRFLLTVALLASHASGSSPVQGQSCDRLPRDCDAEARAFEARARRLRNLADPVEAGLGALKLRRRAACLEWNACALEDAALERLNSWADRELQTLARASGDDERLEWARGLARRGAQASSGEIPTPAAASGYVPELTPQILDGMRRMKDELEGVEAFGPILVRVQRGSLSDGHRAPAVCDSSLPRELRTLTRTSSSDTVRGYAQSLRQLLENICTPWERWAEPDEELELQLVRFQAQVNRIEGWLNDVIRCADPGPWDRRCTNTFGSQIPEALPDARRGLRELARVKRALSRAERFPCFDPVWERIKRTQWTLRTAKANIPDLGDDANRLCGRLRIMGESVRESQQQVKDFADQAVAQLGQLVDSYRQGLRQQQQYWGDRLPEELRP